MDTREPFDDLLPPPAPSSRRPFLLGVLVGCGGSVVLFLGAHLVAGVALVAMMATGHIPNSAAVPGDRLPGATREFLLEESLIEEDEQVLYFYADGFLSLREDGNLFTDRRVISYWESGSEILVEQASYPEIADIVPSLTDGAPPNSEVSVERHDGSSFLLIVSNEDGHDERFVELLLETWERLR